MYTFLVGPDGLIRVKVLVFLCYNAPDGKERVGVGVCKIKGQSIRDWGLTILKKQKRKQ